MLPKHPDLFTDDELEQWIRQLVDRQEPEGIHLDYKETIDVNSKKHRLEAAKDISSFANELGGTLLYGIPQRRDKPDGAPIPTKPYGMESIPGLQEAL